MASWLKRISGSSGYSASSRRETWRGDHLSIRPPATKARKAGLESSLRALGLRAARRAAASAARGS